MKKLITAIALTVALALPFVESAKAFEQYMVARSNTDIWNHSFGRGSLRCTTSIGTTVERSWGKNWSRWIYVDVFGADYFNCHGWVNKENLELLALTEKAKDAQRKRLLKLNRPSVGR